MENKLLSINLDSGSLLEVDINNATNHVLIFGKAHSIITEIPQLKVLNNKNNVEISIYIKSVEFNCDIDLLENFGIFHSVEFYDCNFKNILVVDSYNYKTKKIGFQFSFINELSLFNINIDELVILNSFAYLFKLGSVGHSSYIKELNFEYRFYDSKEDKPIFKYQLEQFNQANKFNCEITIDENLEFIQFNYGNYRIKKPESSGVFRDLFLMSLTINRDQNENKNEKIHIGHTTINNLILYGTFNFIKIGRLFVNSLKFDSFKSSKSKFERIHCFEESEFFVNLDSKIEFYNSELNNCVLWDVRFKEFNKFVALETNFEGATFNLVSVPMRIYSFVDSAKGLYYAYHEYEYYRQFFQIYSNSNDIDNSLIAKSKMLKTYYETEFHKFNMEKKIIFFLLKWSNEFGINWSRALYWIFGLPIILYIIYLYSLGYDFYWNLSKINWNLVGNYCQFINPTHSMDFLTKDKMELSGLAIFMDFLTRIITGFGIYQFITAFRRFGKS